VKYVLSVLEPIFNYDRLYIGGGNAQRIDFALPKNVKVVSNDAGMLGGVRLWEQ
jgi:polyphosphate glucokinase